MGNAKNHRDRASATAASALHLLFPGDAQSVRGALQTAMAVFRRMDLGPEFDGVIEIVLAEALNNVVEHAYAGSGRGVIEIDVVRGPEALAFRIRDDGHPMPQGDMPQGTAHDLDVATDDLPEGGFGWFLIRELTEDLRYRRNGNRNELSFVVPLAMPQTGV